MARNLGWDELATNQAAKEVTINDGLNRLDGAISAELSIAVTSSNAVAIDADDLQSHFAFRLTGSAATGAVAVTLDAGVQRGLVLVINQCGHTATVKVSGESGAGTSITTADTALIYVGPAASMAV